MREGFPSGSESKESSWNVGDLGSIPVMTEAHIELTWFAKNNFWLLKRHPCTHITLWIGRYRQTVCAKSLQLCPPLCHSMNCSPSDSSVHGILHIRILEYVATPPGDLPDPWWNLSLLCLLHWQAGSSPLAPPGKPIGRIIAPKDNLILEPVNKSDYTAKEN